MNTDKVMDIKASSCFILKITLSDCNYKIVVVWLRLSAKFLLACCNQYQQNLDLD